MDTFFPASSPEYQAHALIAEGVWWNPKIGPKEIGLCAAYAALERYVKGEDLYLPPRDTWELQAILRSYSDHVINSLFSQIRSWACPDYRTPKAYAIARQQCATSLHAVLSPEGVLARLVELHTPPATPLYVVPKLEHDDEPSQSPSMFEPVNSQRIRSR